MKKIFLSIIFIASGLSVANAQSYNVVDNNVDADPTLECTSITIRTPYHMMLGKSYAPAYLRLSLLYTKNHAKELDNTVRSKRHNSSNWPRGLR